MKKVDAITPVLFFTLAAIMPVGSHASRILFGLLFVLGWVTAVRIGKPVIAFYGSLRVMLVGTLLMVGVFPAGFR